MTTAATQIDEARRLLEIAEASLARLGVDIGLESRISFMPRLKDLKDQQLYPMSRLAASSDRPARALTPRAPRAAQRSLVPLRDDRAGRRGSSTTTATTLRRPPHERGGASVANARLEQIADACPELDNMLYNRSW